MPYPPVAQRTLHLTLPDESATATFARRLASALSAGCIVWLSGPLGAGKTTLVRSLLAALGHTGSVRSPTFTLLEPYELARFPVYHFDLYRFAAASEWRDAGFEDYFGGPGVCLVEWPEQGGPQLPGPDLHLTLAFGDAPDDPLVRRLTLDACSAAGLQCLNALVLEAQVTHPDERTSS